MSLEIRENNGQKKDEYTAQMGHIALLTTKATERILRLAKSE
jgi:hypothetical protein